MNKETLGQLFILGFEGTTLDAGLKDLIREYRPGGVILFKRNLEDPDQILGLTESLQDASPVRPLLITIDQEGGRVWRLPPPFTLFPEAQALGRIGLDSLAYASAKVMAQELAAVGIHCNFSPVLDLNTNPANPVIGDRSLGTEPLEVASLARAMLLGFRDHGIAGCGKHFPGHGDTDLDSHHELPVVNHDRARIDAVEMAPYRILLKDARHPLELVMTGHLLVPGLDSKRPATLSRRILHGLLRRQLGFSGLIITDDLEMGAIAATHPPEEAALLAFRAGADLLMFCHTPDCLPGCIDSLSRALTKGHVSSHRLRRSLHRIQAFRKRLRERTPSTWRRRDLFNRIGCPEHRHIPERVCSLSGSGSEPSSAP